MRLSILAVLAACSASSIPTPAAHSPASGITDPTHTLSITQPWYFASEWGDGAKFLELRTDGTYRSIDREHMGVGEDDVGRWRQTADGELLLCSSYQYAHIEAGRLWIVVARAQQYAELPELARRLRALLASGRSTFAFKREIEWPFSAGEEDYAHPSINDDGDGGDIARADVEHLVHAIDTYLSAGDQNLMRTTVRVYHDMPYLDGSWELPRRPHDASDVQMVHKQLDAHEGGLSAVRALDAASFRAATHQTQPFVVHTEMNDCVHREFDEIPDWKKERLIPGCRSF